MSDGVQFISDFIAKREADVADSIKAITNRAKVSPDGQLQAGVAERSGGASQEFLASNPIINMGIDTANQAVTNVTQQLIVTGEKQLEQAVNRATGIDVRKTIQNVTDSYFAVVGLASTASIEVALELARLNARLIIKNLDEKDLIIKDLIGDVNQLYNAIVILLNSQPFFQDYFSKLIQAYQKILVANQNIKSVASVLKQIKSYNQVLYNSSLVSLGEARDLMLPDRSAQIGEINPIQMLQATITRKTNKDALAAAATIPGISFRMGTKFIRYVAVTLEINSLLALFTNALNSFIQQYKRNDNIDATTINHITAGTNQLDALLSDMKAVLYPNATAPIAQRNGTVTLVSSTFITVKYNNDKSESFRYDSNRLTPSVSVGSLVIAGQPLTTAVEQDRLYSGLVTTSATMWGIRLTAIIEWLKIQPGKASAELDITGESVTRYNTAVSKLNLIGDKTVGLATLKITKAQEQTLDTSQSFAANLLLANKVVATQEAPADVRNRFIQLRNRFEAALILDADIRNALTPFINTPFELLKGADRVVKQLSQLTRSLGFDRGADLLEKADFTGFFNSNADTITYAGAAVAGVTSILGGVLGNPNSTDSDVRKITTIQDKFSRRSENQKVEATRGTASSAPIYQAKQEADLSQDRQDADKATEVAKKQDPEIAESPLTKAESLISKALKNTFNSGSFPKLGV